MKLSDDGLECDSVAQAAANDLKRANIYIFSLDSVNYVESLREKKSDSIAAHWEAAYKGEVVIQKTDKKITFWKNVKRGLKVGAVSGFVGWCIGKAE